MIVYKCLYFKGDFFVTCHSNLPLIHVVFHLVVNDARKYLKNFASKKKHN